MISFEQSPILASLRNVFPQPDAAVRAQLCYQLMTALENYYVHLPQKRAGFGIDPVQQLRLLEASDGRGFTRSLIGIVNGLRDRHTTLKLSQPWTGILAYVPFVLERFYEDGRYRYLLTKNIFGFDAIPVGTEINYWNGTPIELYVRSQARDTQGANWDAQIRLAIANLTIKPLAYTLMPQEDWVTLNYTTPEGKPGTFSTPWRYYMLNTGSIIETVTTGGVNHPSALAGLDEMTYVTNEFRNTAVQLSEKEAVRFTTELDGQLRYAAIPAPVFGKDAKCGYIRLTTFEVPDATLFVKRMADVLQQLPQDRLIIDIRSNPGGLIPAGQKFIRLLTSGSITPSPVAFRNTPETRFLGQIPQFQGWQHSLNIQFSTGQTFSQALPVTTYEDVPDYRYPGKVILIIDSLCYSTSDFFSADFKDNNVGTIVGIDASTGGGGANVWGWALLSNFVGGAGLPPGYDFNIAMRRSLRTGTAVGLPVEDLGVPADFIHQMTRRDLLDNNFDLLQFTLSLFK